LAANDANYFTPSAQDVRIASARRDKPVATLEDITKVLQAMPSSTPVEKRDRALIAFSILSGARDGALASFRLKHVDMACLLNEADDKGWPIYLETQERRSANLY
jgi:integrase